MMNNSPPIGLDASPTPRKRPGPFGPAHALLPKDQLLLTLPDSTIASDAIERMIDLQFSQVPVTNTHDEIVGVFTFRSFTTRVFDLKGVKLDALDLEIKELMDPASFIGRDVYIDTETDWGNIDFVLVGKADDPIGILTISDVLGRLTDFAEAFVLLYEIEHEIRDLINDVYSESELSNCLDEMNMSFRGPTIEITKQLTEYIKEKNEKSVVLGKALRVLKSSTSRPLESLEDFTFSQYSSLICAERNWEDFKPMFGRLRELVEIDFQKVNKLRNIVFHFRRQVTVGDTDLLRRFRDGLRDNRDWFAKHQD